MRALVPVNLRPLEKAYELGNQFGLVFLDLPIGIENPVERLYAVRANMRALKGCYQPVLALGLLAAMGAGPKLLQDQLLQALARNAHGGDDQRAGAAAAALPRRRDDRQASCSGCRSRATSAWACRSSPTMAPCSSASSPTAGLVPDPERVIARFRPEFEKLVLTDADGAAVDRAISIRPSRRARPASTSRPERLRVAASAPVAARAARQGHAGCVLGDRERFLEVLVQRHRELPGGEPAARRPGGSRPTGTARSARG